MAVNETDLMRFYPNTGLIAAFMYMSAALGLAGCAFLVSQHGLVMSAHSQWPELEMG